MSVPPVAILGCGMMTGVGLTAEASCAAIRCAIDNFRETRFIASGGEWIIGSEVPLDEPWRGMPKLARLLAGPLRECLDVIPDVPPESIPVLLCVAEENRPGRLEGLGNPLFFEACELLGVRFHDRSRVIAQGRIGGAVGLGSGALVGDQLQGQEHKQADQQRQIDSNQAEIERQRRELDRLKKQNEY